MLFNGFKLMGRTTAAASERAFVKRVSVIRKRHPVDLFLVVGWSLILVKCLLSSWAVARWDIPINVLWVWIPSFICAGVCTYLYIYRD